MNEREWSFGGLRVYRRMCRFDAPTLVAHLSRAEGEALETGEWTLICIDGADWNRDLTPWPAKAAFRGQPDFAGGAKAHLKRLMDEILPAAEEGLRPPGRSIMGYSLAGMFALYAALETDAFDSVASVSGSLWYPGFAEYVEAGAAGRPEFAYFSVGDREKLGRNAAFHSIEENTLRIVGALRGRGAEAMFERNPGGHFTDPQGRMARAVKQMMQRTGIE